MKPLSAMSPYLRPTSENFSVKCENTKPLWICHLLSLYLLLQAASLTKKPALLETVLVQVCLSLLHPNPKEQSQCYQKIIGQKPLYHHVLGFFSSSFLFQIPSLSFFFVMNGHVLAENNVSSVFSNGKTFSLISHFNPLFILPQKRRPVPIEHDNASPIMYLQRLESKPYFLQPSKNTRIKVWKCEDKRDDH